MWHKGSASSAGTGKKSIRYLDARNLWVVLRKHKWAGYNGRSEMLTRFIYFRYFFHWYCAEHEAGNTAAAEATLDGVVDGLRGVEGPYVDRRRPGRTLLKAIFELGRRFPRRAPKPALEKEA